MTQEVFTGRVGASDTPSHAAARPARLLLGCGVLAGSLFITVALAQAFTRPGFDVLRHPISLLSLGTLGWVQITDFVGSGVLLVALAIGVRLRAGSGHRRHLPDRPRARLPARDSGRHAGGGELARNAARRRLPHLVRLGHRSLLRVRPPLQRARPAAVGPVLRGHGNDHAAAHRSGPGPPSRRSPGSALGGGWRARLLVGGRLGSEADGR